MVERRPDKTKVNSSILFMPTLETVSEYSDLQFLMSRRSLDEGGPSNIRTLSSMARASRLHREGWGFESLSVHQK